MAFKHPPQLDLAEKKALLSLARTTLNYAFQENADGALRGFEMALGQYSGALRENHPCFVTLLSMGIQLRGCIGTLQTESPLYLNVHDYALKAAFQDPRFPPLKVEELETLQFEITVLGPPKPLRRLEDLEIGKHGLIVEKGSQRGVLLAQVATEWGWDKAEFVRHTCEKAGLEPDLWQSYTLSYFEEIAFKEELT